MILTPREAAAPTPGAGRELDPSGQRAVLGGRHRIPRRHLASLTVFAPAEGSG